MAAPACGIPSSSDPSGSCLTGHYGLNGTSAIDALAFSPDGRTLLTGGRLNPTVAWDSVLWADPETDPDGRHRANST